MRRILEKLRARRERRRTERARVLTNAELTDSHHENRRSFRLLGAFVALIVLGGALYGLQQRSDQDDIAAGQARTDAVVAKLQIAVDRLDYVIDRQEYDRCMSGNSFRTFTKDANTSLVTYIDTLLNAFGTLNPPAEQLARATPAQRAQYEDVIRKINDARASKLAENDDPAIATRDCGDPPKPPDVRERER